MRACFLALLAAAGCGRTAEIVPDAGGAADFAGATRDLGTPVDLASGPPMISHLLDGKGLLLAGVTRDDHAVYYHPQGYVAAIPLGGGAPATVAKSAIAIVSGTVVFAWANYNGQAETGTLFVWTAAAGAHQLASGSNFRAFAATGDGSAVLYLANYSAQAHTADLLVSRSDGTGTRVVFPKIETGGSCPPIVAAARERFVLAHCTPGGQIAAVDEIDRQGNVRPLLKNAIDFATVDGVGDLALAIDSAGFARAFPIGGAPGPFVDQNAIWAALSSDGAFALLQSANGRLRRTRVVNSMPVTMVPNGVVGVWGTSSDVSAALFYRNYSQGMHFSTDMWLASSDGEAVQLLQQSTGCIFGDTFTGDGRHALYLADCTPDVGALYGAPVGGGPQAKLASATWIVWAADGDRVVYNDGYTETGGANGRGDLYFGPASGGARTLVASQAEVDFFLARDRRRVVYSLQSQPGAEGLYVAALPP